MLVRKEPVMDGDSDTPKTVEEYIDGFPPKVQTVLKRLRKEIKAAAPGAEERIGYGMPAYYLNGPLAYFAAFERHIGFYPTPTGIELFEDRLKAYKKGKGSVQFPIDEEPPYDLIKEMVRYRVEENAKKTVGKKRPDKPR
jgi:uncharacterized protein YdhG (YjbR/CyaY superfamily)